MSIIQSFSPTTGSALSRCGVAPWGDRFVVCPLPRRSSATARAPIRMPTVIDNQPSAAPDVKRMSAIPTPSNPVAATLSAARLSFIPARQSAAPPPSQTDPMR